MPDSPARSRELRSDLPSRASWVLVCAHPGHELRAHHFLERYSPRVFVLTDGSGSTGASRAGDSRALIQQAGAAVGEPFGRLTDRDAYAALMRADAAPFAAFVEAVTEHLIEARVGAVAVDAAEGYNPVHDVCRWIGAAAAARAVRGGVDVDLYEVDLVGPPDGAGDGLRLRLDDAALERKLAAARAYEPLRDETETAVARFGRDAFRVEFLRAATGGVPPAAGCMPHYERVGADRVRDGRYDTVLRYGAHVRPVVLQLLDAAGAPEHAATFSPADQ